MDINAALTTDPNAVTSRVVLTKKADGSDDAVLIIVGPDADAAKLEQARQRREGLKRRNKKALDLTTDNGAQEMDAAVQDNLMGTACAAVVGWEGFTENGQEKPFDPAAVRMLLTKFTEWRDAVLSEHNSNTAFLPK